MYRRIYSDAAAPAMFLRVAVVLKDSPVRIVTPEKEALPLKDATDDDTPSSGMAGIKHSILSIFSVLKESYRREDNLSFILRNSPSKLGVKTDFPKFSDISSMLHGRTSSTSS